MHAGRTLEELEIFRIALKLGDDVWSWVILWNEFSRRTVGVQFVRAADSIAANIAEGYGRFHFRDRIQFFYYARGSVLETKTWTIKALKRDLITQQEQERFLELLKALHYQLNAYIKNLKGHSTKS